MKKLLVALAVAGLTLSGVAAAADYYDDETKRTEVHQSTGGHNEPTAPDKDGPRVSGSIWVHLYGFDAGEVVRVKIENRGDHPTDPYGKVAGPWHLVADVNGAVRGPSFSLPAGKYKVKTQINYGTDAEAKDYHNFVIVDAAPAPSCCCP